MSIQVAAHLATEIGHVPEIQPGGMQVIDYIRQPFRANTADGFLPGDRCRLTWL